jgi:hypothetical protein
MRGRDVTTGDVIWAIVDGGLIILPEAGELIKGGTLTVEVGERTVAKAGNIAAKAMSDVVVHDAEETVASALAKSAAKSTLIGQSQKWLLLAGKHVLPLAGKLAAFAKEHPIAMIATCAAIYAGTHPEKIDKLISDLEQTVAASPGRIVETIARELQNLKDQQKMSPWTYYPLCALVYLIVVSLFLAILRRLLQPAFDWLVRPLWWLLGLVMQLVWAPRRRAPVASKEVQP